MSVRSVGIEEELLLVDPVSRQATPASSRVLKQFHEHAPAPGKPPTPTAATDELDQELFRHQLEIRTDPATDLSLALRALQSARRTAHQAARAADVNVIASGIVPLTGDRPQVTRNARYEDMVTTYGEIAQAGATCGMHVHVEISSDEEGVMVIDRLAPWLPVILALSANSPITDGQDTGYASWRSQMLARWPSSGPTEPFGSVQNYREVGRRLIASGAARDEGMLYFDARLAKEHPTVEVRIADVTATPDDAVTLAALVRALVQTAAAGELPGNDRAAGASRVGWTSELLRAAQWRAARYGLSSTLVHPATGETQPAREVVESLVQSVETALLEARDLDLVCAGVEHLRHASGATLQRAAFERLGTVEGVVDDLVARTEASW